MKALSKFLLKCSLAAGLVYVGGWKVLWQADPIDVAIFATTPDNFWKMTALFGPAYNGSTAKQIELMKQKSTSNPQVAQGYAMLNTFAISAIGDHFVTSHGIGFRVNGSYYGLAITARYFDSPILSWICLGAVIPVFEA